MDLSICLYIFTFVIFYILFPICDSCFLCPFFNFRIYVEGDKKKKKEIKNPLQISINYLRGGACISLTVVYANRIRGINILEGADICPDILNR